MTRKRKHSGIRKYLLWGSLALALILLAAFLSARSTPKDIIKASQRTSKALERRMNSLESQIKIALEDSEGWIGSLALPEDMVIYRYVEDTLQSWCNQFPVKNDDITGKVVIQRLSRPRETPDSPCSGWSRNQPQDLAISSGPPYSQNCSLPLSMLTGSFSTHWEPSSSCPS